MSNKVRLKEMFETVFAGSDFDEELVRRFFGPEYVQSVDGKSLDFESFLRHLKIVKDSTKTMSFHYRSLAEEGDIVFSNHVVKGETKEGGRAEAHVIAEFRFRDGKIVSCDELTHLISGDKADRDLGSRS